MGSRSRSWAVEVWMPFCIGERRLRVSEPAEGKSMVKGWSGFPEHPPDRGFHNLQGFQESRGRLAASDALSDFLVRQASGTERSVRGVF